MKLWKFSRTTGLWREARSVTTETAGEWLKIFQKDEPNEQFVVATKRPVTNTEKTLRKQVRERKTR